MHKQIQQEIESKYLVEKLILNFQKISRKLNSFNNPQKKNIKIQKKLENCIVQLSNIVNNYKLTDMQLQKLTPSLLSIGKKYKLTDNSLLSKLLLATTSSMKVKDLSINNDNQDGNKDFSMKPKIQALNILHSPSLKLKSSKFSQLEYNNSRSNMIKPPWKPSGKGNKQFNTFENKKNISFVNENHTKKSIVKETSKKISNPTPYNNQLKTYSNKNYKKVVYGDSQEKQKIKIHGKSDK